MIAHAHADPRKPARVVLLGAGGFIARAIARRLASENMSVLPLGRPALDLTNPDAVAALGSTLKGDDAVVVLAALTPDKGRDNATLMKNMAMMQHACAALERTGCAHLAYFSSDAVYGTGPATVNEDTPAAPQDLYGAMHLARELMARAVPKAPLLILRPTLVYGAEDTHNAYGPNRFRRTAQKDGEIQLFGGGEETRDHIHVDDVAALTARCLMRRSTGTLNVATGRSVSFAALAEMVAQQFPSRPEIVTTPRANPVTHRHYDIINLVKAFPEYRFITLEDGLARCHGESKGAA
jgi:nucleoside-diphosphate-sugar epimerase